MNDTTPPRKPRPPRPPRVPEAFGQELHELLKIGAVETRVITLPSHSDAVGLRHRLSKLRVSMRYHGHPLLHLAEQCTVSIRPIANSDKCDLIVQPVDKKYREAIRLAGIDLDQPLPTPASTPDAPLPEPEPEPLVKAPDAPPSPIEKYLKK